jgi:hypothetical protein
MEGHENTILKWPSGTFKTDSYPEANFLVLKRVK